MPHVEVCVWMKFPQRQIFPDQINSQKSENFTTLKFSDVRYAD